MIKKILILILFLISTIMPVNAEENKVLTGSVSIVPQSFYGTWRVVSKRIETDSPSNFKEKGLDIWNLSQTHDVITLCNLFNGAKAQIKINKSDSKYIEFYKSGKYNQKELNDKVEIYLDGDKFVGFDTLELNTYVDGKIVKTNTAKYSIKGEKIAGQVE